LTAPISPSGNEEKRLLGDEEELPDKVTMLLTIIAVLLTLWMLGFGLGMGGSMIHVLRGVALAAFAVTWELGGAA